MGPRYGVARPRQPLAVRVLAVAIEHIPAPAFVISARRVVVANQRGHAWLADAARLGLLDGAAGPDRDAFEVSSFAIAGAHHYFAVLRAPVRDRAPEIARASAWRLTRRELEVVEQLLSGASNRRIAGALGCSVKTVEHHVSAILRKAGVETRTQLIIALRDG